VPNIVGSISAFFAFSKRRREDLDHEFRQVVGRPRHAASAIRTGRISVAEREHMGEEREHMGEERESLSEDVEGHSFLESPADVDKEKEGEGPDVEGHTFLESPNDA
jgi:hypothetical protein